MKKKIFPFSLIYILWNVIIYVSVAFYNLSFNPVDLGEGGRFAVIAIGVFGGFYVASWVFILDDISKLRS